MPSSAETHRVCFGIFEANLRTGELRKGGMKIRLQYQSFQILELLLASPGEVVSREQIRATLWPSDTFVDFDHGLNKSMNKLRVALGDSAAKPKYVETLARRGYRFIAPVDRGKGTEQRGTHAASKMRLVVLPFENLGPDLQDEYFSDGLTEEMISQLGQLNPERLGVIARTSAIQYKRTSKRITDIAQELSVDYVLEGSVRKSGTRARITAQLIEARGQSHVWAASYDRDLADIFAVQNEVVCRIARALAVELLPEELVARSRADSLNPAAYEAYLRGRFSWEQRSENGLRAANAYFRQALEVDPKFAPAYVGIAESTVLLPWFGAATPHDAAAKARDAAIRAVQLNPNLPEVHCCLALLRFWYDWDWDSAEEEFQKAIELNPNYATVHHWYSAYLVAMARFDEAARQQELAQQLDPFSLIIANAAGHIYLYSQRYAEAIRTFEGVTARDPSFVPAHFNLAQAYLYTGRYEEAISIFERAALWSGNAGASAALARAHAYAGNRAKARDILEGLMRASQKHYVSSPLIALVYFAVGQLESGFDYLEKGFHEHSYWMTFLKVEPAYAPLSDHVRFRQLLQSLNFESAISRYAA